MRMRITSLASISSLTSLIISSMSSLKMREAEFVPRKLAKSFSRFSYVDKLFAVA